MRLQRGQTFSRDSQALGRDPVTDMSVGGVNVFDDAFSLCDADGTLAGAIRVSDGRSRADRDIAWRLHDALGPANAPGNFYPNRHDHTM